MEQAARALNEANTALYIVDARALIGALQGLTAVPNAEARGPGSLRQLQMQMGRGESASPRGLNGSWHDLKVAVDRRGVSVRYRRSYLASGMVVAATEGPTPEALLNDPFDATQIELVAETTPDHVQVTIDLHDVHLEKQNAMWIGATDVTFLVEGSSTARTITRKLEIPDAQLAAALEKGIVVNDSIAADGNTGTLRIVAQDRATGAAGSLRIRLNRK